MYGVVLDVKRMDFDFEYRTLAGAYKPRNLRKTYLATFSIYDTELYLRNSTD